MTVKVTGSLHEVQRIITGMYSFDYAFENDRGDIGFPIGTVVEIYGPSGIGKTTTVLSLAGILANTKQQDIGFIDLEGFDPRTMTVILESVGFDGEIHCIAEMDDETALEKLTTLVQNKKQNFGVGILDSIGAISPIEEASNKLGAANMGRRGRLLAQFSRRMVKTIRDNPKYPVYIMINHQYPILGGRGFAPPGGDAKKYLSWVQIQLKRTKMFPDGSYVLEGKIKKNRYGYEQRLFYWFVLAGKGIHVGLTAVWDGVV